MTTASGQDIRERSFVFGCAVVRLALAVVAKPGVRVLVDQLVKSGTSIGANLEEAKAASSRREFVRYVEIALREARETLYWLRIWTKIELGPSAHLTELRGEADQIVRILTTIVINTKRRIVFVSA